MTVFGGQCFGCNTLHMSMGERCSECQARWESATKNERKIILELEAANRRISEMSKAMVERVRRDIVTEHPSDIEQELDENVKTLLSLVHPDKHDGMKSAHDMTLWLLSVKDRDRTATRPTRMAENRRKEVAPYHG